MKTIRELLRDADPLQHEPWPSSRVDFRRQAIITAASAAGAPPAAGSRRRIAVFATVALLGIAAPFLGSRGWSLFVNDLQAAIRFEVRLAEDRGAPGLREVKVSGSGRSVYLHSEVVVTNSDIAAGEAELHESSAGTVVKYCCLKLLSIRGHIEAGSDQHNEALDRLTRCERTVYGPCPSGRLSVQPDRAAGIVVRRSSRPSLPLGEAACTQHR